MDRLILPRSFHYQCLDLHPTSSKAPCGLPMNFLNINKQAHYIKQLIIGSIDYKLITQITSSLLLIIPAKGLVSGLLKNVKILLVCGHNVN
ncbi:hypothetical protein Syun_001057 [Stephania yunnanensis]|uniref:Uncharacterized protein n=1 Tax=Stephania yunnanensis TaxID=152371 RepID=A0AAP0LET5_9MAGN